MYLVSTVIYIPVYQMGVILALILPPFLIRYPFNNRSMKCSTMDWAWMFLSDSVSL